MTIRYVVRTLLALLVATALGCGGGGGGGGTTDTTPPSVAITAPASTSSVSGTVAITASASDNVGVSKVEFYLDGTLQATVTSAPYGFSWNSSSVSTGTHTLTAKAYDAANNATTSSPVSLAVNGPVTGPANATLTLNIPSLPASTLVAGVEFIITLPQGVSPAIFSGNDASGSITLINGGVNLSLKDSNYDSAANTIKFVGVTTTGFGAGNFATVKCTIATGTTITPSDLSISDIQVLDATPTSIGTINMSVLLL